MIVYKLHPIDYWNGWQKPSDLFRVTVDYPDLEWFDPATWAPMWAKARVLARKIGWEGDVSQGPYVTVLPGSPQPSVVIGWKQANDGTTFIATPVVLPWLERVATRRIEDLPAT